MFHRSNLGSFGSCLPCDAEGYVPEQGDRFEQFAFDALWAPDEEEWAQFVADAVEATQRAEAALGEWQEANV